MMNATVKRATVGALTRVVPGANSATYRGQKDEFEFELEFSSHGGAALAADALRQVEFAGRDSGYAPPLQHPAR